ncbi:MAG: nitrogenase stabilizing/protective protein NifW [Magnetospirillum sp.]|nr:nitrogenase stabilizing/protective protein NifW [Magnetospirillum sp.]
MSALDDLKKLSAAEDFFAALAVPYDPATLAVARLHIMRRMGQYLAEGDLGGLDDATLRLRCQEHLRRAYEDFVKSSPLDQRVFKVLKEAVAPARKGFVALSALQAGGSGTAE